ncbi:hypothetical protein FIBSPDRAFT_362910 [Athelia psychrophila]|uniref:Uncharacterized protein n=1 Tax=Athelia psychrophila TaxID=1759441 RepID=A0A166PE55_9AGAM|nr:hypothetical protein FIBSPDRAFT_362910 [Fibularhizoctonia sp. CBS 109695]
MGATGCTSPHPGLKSLTAHVKMCQNLGDSMVHEREHMQRFLLDHFFENDVRSIANCGRIHIAIDFTKELLNGNLPTFVDANKACNEISKTRNGLTSEMRCTGKENAGTKGPGTATDSSWTAPLSAAFSFACSTVVRVCFESSVFLDDFVPKC